MICRTRSGSVPILALLLMIVPLFFLPGIHGSPLDPVDPIIQLSLEPGEQRVEVKPGSNNITSFSLGIVCDIPSTMNDNLVCSLALTASAGSWKVTKIPVLNFTRAEDQRTITINVHVPINTSSEDDRYLVIDGKWSYSENEASGDVSAISGFIDVVPFYNIYVGSNHPHIGTDVGNRVEFEVMIKNRGNSNINVSLFVDVDNSFLNFNIMENPIFIEKGKWKNITISVRQTPSRSRESKIDLTFTIDEDERELEYDQELMLKTGPKWSTLMYEWKFTVLMIVIGIIAIVAFSLYLYEKRTGGNPEDLEEEDL